MRLLLLLTACIFFGCSAPIAQEKDDDMPARKGNERGEISNSGGSYPLDTLTQQVVTLARCNYEWSRPLVAYVSLESARATGADKDLAFFGVLRFGHEGVQIEVPFELPLVGSLTGQKQGLVKIPFNASAGEIVGTLGSQQGLAFGSADSIDGGRVSAFIAEGTSSVEDETRPRRTLYTNGPAGIGAGVTLPLSFFMPLIPNSSDSLGIGNPSLAGSSMRVLGEEGSITFTIETASMLAAPGSDFIGPLEPNNVYLTPRNTVAIYIKNSAAIPKAVTVEVFPSF